MALCEAISPPPKPRPKLAPTCRSGVPTGLFPVLFLVTLATSKVAKRLDEWPIGQFVIREPLGSSVRPRLCAPRCPRALGLWPHTSVLPEGRRPPLALLAARPPGRRLGGLAFRCSPRSPRLSVELRRPLQRRPSGLLDRLRSRSPLTARLRLATQGWLCGQSLPDASQRKRCHPTGIKM